MSTMHATPAQSAPIAYNPDSPRWIAALAKATRIAETYGPFAFGGINGKWLVEGSNESYYVRETPEGLTCTCEGAQYGCCYHMASVVLKLQARKPLQPKPVCSVCGMDTRDPLHEVVCSE